jgi:ubiquinone/menaquinone biosynthesis C-methylase UbiE
MRRLNDAEIKSAIIKKWDTDAEYYDTHVSHGIQTVEEKDLWADLFRELIRSGSREVLDVGCGTGAMALILAEMGHIVKGIDLSEGMMDVGRKKAEARGVVVDFSRGDAESLSFADDTFDVVVNRHLLWTLPHPEKALSEWKRVVRPGGMIVVIDGLWDDGSPGTKIRQSLGRCLSQVFNPDTRGASGYSEELSGSLPHAGGVSMNEAQNLFVKAGFSAVSVKKLHTIRENQRSRKEWYQNLGYDWEYYAISGTKRE